MTASNIKEILKIHELNSVLVPGIFFLYGLNLIFPELDRVKLETLNIGAIVIFLFLSYGAGFSIQSLGNFIEIFIIERLWGDLKKKKNKHKLPNKEDKKIFKNHKKLCRGLASSLFILLMVALMNHSLSTSSPYNFIVIIFIFLLFWYMRKFESRELGIEM